MQLAGPHATPMTAIRDLLGAALQDLIGADIDNKQSAPILTNAHQTDPHSATAFGRRCCPHRLVIEIGITKLRRGSTEER